jgi:uncharacterized protein (TIGR00369 family)
MKRTVTKKQHNSKMCFVCGLKNVAGLKASFYETDDGALVATFTPRGVHQSYPGRLHGGIASTILDETIGRAVMISSKQEIWGVTLELTVEYKKPIPLDGELRVVGRITEQNSRFFSGTGEILLPDGTIAVLARGRYMKVPLDKIADFNPTEFEWAVVQKANDPEAFQF